MKRLSSGYQTVGALNICGALLLLYFAAINFVPARPEEKLSATAVLAASLLGLSGFGLAFAGIGLLSGPQYWRATRVLLFVLAALLLMQGLRFGWILVDVILGPPDAFKALVFPLLGLPAAVVLWSIVLGVVGVRIGRYLAPSVDKPNKSLQ